MTEKEPSATTEPVPTMVEPDRTWTVEPLSDAADVPVSAGVLSLVKLPLVGVEIVGADGEEVSTVTEIPFDAALSVPLSSVAWKI